MCFDKALNPLSSVEYKLDPSVVNVTIYPKVSQTRTASIDIINKNNTIINSQLYDKNAYVVNNSLRTKKVNSIVRSSLGTRVKFHNIITSPTTVAFITPLTGFYSREIINTIILYKSHYNVTKRVILDKDSYGVIWTKYKNHKAVILNHNLDATVNIVIRTITGESFRYSDIILNNSQIEIILPEDFSVSSFNVDIFPIYKES